MKRIALLTGLLFVLLLYSCANEEENSKDSGTFIDKRDGKSYSWVRIGTQVWMADNLAYYTDIGCWAYDDNNKKVNSYGYLYNWQTAQNVCPQGWHLPSKQEFETLLDNYGGSRNWDIINYNALIPGGSSDFSAVLGGWRDKYEGYDLIDSVGNYWTSTQVQNNPDYAWNLFLDNSVKEAGMDFGYRKVYGFSVRCVQD